MAIAYSFIVALNILIPIIVKVSFGNFTISYYLFLTIILFFSLIFLLLIKHNYFTERYPQKVKKYLIIFFISSLSLIPFTFATPYITQFSSSFQFFTQLFLGILGWYVFKNEQEIMQFIKIVFFAVVLACFYGIYTYITKTNPYITSLNIMFSQEMDATSFMEEKRGGLEGRIMATCIHPLMWGQLIALLVSFFIIFYKKYNKLLGQCIIILLTTAAFLSGSRAVIFSLIIVFSFQFLTLPLRNKIILLFIGVGFILALLGSSFSDNKTFKLIQSSAFVWDEKLSSNADVNGSSLSMRTEQLECSYDLIKNNIFTGLGKGWISHYIDKQGEHPIMHGFESVFFSKFIEGGIFGLFFFLLFYFQIYLYIRKDAKYKLGTNQANLIDGFFLGYFFSILFTGIQSTFFMFIVLSIVLLKYFDIQPIKNNNFELTIHNKKSVLQK
jgi:hypothetical protein